MKRIIALVLVLALALSLVACTKESDVIGAWERETTYLEAYGCDTTMYLLIASNGSIIKMLLTADGEEILSLDIGEWELNGNEIEAVWENSAGTTAYKVRGNSLKNGDLKYTQTDRAEDVFAMLYSIL